MAAWNDPIAGALQSSATYPQPGQFQTPTSDALAAQQGLPPAGPDPGAGAMGGGSAISVSQVTPGRATASNATPYGFNPSTGKLLVNGREVPHDIALWKTAAEMPPDALQPMDVHAIGSDGYLPMSQQQLQDFLARVQPDSTHLSSIAHNVGAGVKEVLGGALREGAKLAMPAPGDTSPLAMFAKTATPAPLVSMMVDSMGRRVGVDSATTSINNAAGGIDESLSRDVAQSDVDRRAGMTLAQQAAEDVTFGEHPGTYTANLFSHGLARSAPALAAFAVNPVAGAAAFGAQSSHQLSNMAGEHFDQLTKNLSPEQMAAVNPKYAQLRQQGHDDMQARAILRDESASAAGDIGAVTGAASGYLGGRIPMAMIGRASAMAPAMGGSGAGGFLLRRLGMAALTGGENAGLNLAAQVPGQIAGDVAGGQGVQDAGSYLDGHAVFDSLLSGSVMGAMTRSHARIADPVQVLQDSDIGAAAQHLNPGDAPLPQQSALPPSSGPAPQGMPEVPITTSPGAGPAVPPPMPGASAPAAPAFTTSPGAAPDGGAPPMRPDAPAAPDFTTSPGVEAPTPTPGAVPPSPDWTTSPGVARTGGPRIQALREQRAAAAQVDPNAPPVGALPPPGPTAGQTGQVARLQTSLQLVQDMLESGNFNKRTKAGKATIARLEAERDALTAQIKEADNAVLGEQIGQARAERPPAEGASFVGDPATGQLEIPMPHEPSGDPRLTGSEPPVGAGPGTSMEPPPIANPIPMSPAEAASRLQAQRARNPENRPPQEDLFRPQLKAALAERATPPALEQAVATSERGVSPSTPEPAGDLAAQAARLGKGSDVLFVAKGNEAQMPKTPRGMRKVVRDEGTLITSNAAKAKAFREAPAIDDALLARLQGLPETKAQALKRGRAEVIAAEDKAGNVVKEAVSTPGGPNDAVVAAATPPGGKTVRRTALEAQSRRAAKVAEETTAPMAPGEYRGKQAFKHGDATISYDVGKDGVQLNLLRVPREARGQGAARAAMEQFTAAADAADQPIRLSVAEQDGTTTPEGLTKLYKSVGFVDDGTSAAGLPQLRRPAASERTAAPAKRSRVDLLKDAAAKKRAEPKKKVAAPVTPDELTPAKPSLAKAKAATEALLEDVRQNHPHLEEPSDTAPGHAGAGRTAESPLTRLPLTDLEMGTLADRVVATAAHEQAQLEAGGGQWSPKRSAVRRVLESMNLPISSEVQLRGLVRDISRMDPQVFRQLLQKMAPRIADNTLAKGIVRGMSEVLAAVHATDRDGKGVVGRRELDEPSDATPGANHSNALRMDVGTGKREIVPAPEVNRGAPNARVLVYGKEVPSNAADVVGHWVKTIEASSGRVLPDHIHIMTPNEALARYGAQVGDHAAGNGFAGEMKGPDGKMETVVAVDWKGLGEGPAAIEALAHEVAHVTASRIFEHIDKADQVAVRRAFNDWLEISGRGTPTEQMLSRLPPALGDLLRQSGAKPERAYSGEWHEWVADEVAKWMVTSQKPRTGVERFLSKVAAAVKSLYANITGRGRPTEAVQQMMDNWVASGKALRSADAAARAGAMDYGRTPAEPVRPAEAARAKIATRAMQAKMASAVDGAKAIGKDVAAAIDGDRAGITRQLHNSIAAVAHGKAGDFIRRVSFEVSNMTDMVGRYGGKEHGKFGEGLTRWDHAMRLAEKYSKDAQQQGQLAIERAQRLSTPVRNVLEDLMYKSTTYGVHPDEAFGTGKNKHLANEDSGIEDGNRRRYGEVQALWRQLDGLQGNPRTVYRDLRDAMGVLHRDIFEARREHIDGLDIDAEAKEDAHRMLNVAEERMLEGPYFPLVREGSYITTAQTPFKALGEFPTEAEAKLAGRREKAANPHAEIHIEKTPDGYDVKANEQAVYFHDTLADALAARKDIEAELREAWAHSSVADQFDDALRDAKHPLISQPFTTVDFFRKAETPTSGSFMTAINKLRDKEQLDPQAYQTLAEMYIESLPEASPRKAYLRRENIRGANRRMLAGYGRRLLGAAHSYGQTKISGERNGAWNQMTAERKTRPEYGKVMSDLYRRQEILAKRMVHNPLNTFASTVQDASSFMSLAFSPAFLMQQILQPLVLSAPVLAARAGKDGKAVGYGKVMDALKDAYAGAPKFFGARGLQQFQAEFKRLMGTYGGDGLTLQQSADALISKFGRTDDEQSLLHYMHDRGTLDFSFLNATNDATTLSATGSKAKSIMRLSMAFAQQVEAMNRTVTGLAAYRLAREARGMEHADAVREANAVVSQTHGDYSRYNRPSAFNRPILGMALQFKMYTQFMYSLLISNVAHAMNPKLSKVERAQALRTLGYVIGSHGVIGGTVGLGPVAGAAKLALGALMYGMASTGMIDEKKRDQTLADWIAAETESYGDEVFGAGNGHALRKVGTYGLLGALGTSMAQKISIPDLTDTRFTGKTASEKDVPGDMIDRYALSALGSVYSNTKRVANGTGRLLEGDVTGAAKQILPAAPRALLNAATESQDGVVTGGGKVLRSADDIGPYGTFLRAMGTNSADTDMMYDDRSRRQAVIDRSSAKRADFIKAYREADPADRGAVIEQVAEYNRGRPKELQISPATLKRAIDPRSTGPSKLEKAAGRAIGQ